MPPRRLVPLLDPEMKTIIKFLHRTTKSRRAVCASVIPSEVLQYAKFRVDYGGDTMPAREMVPITDTSRDASFVRVSHPFLHVSCLQ
jgi:hypothetical protein